LITSADRNFSGEMQKTVLAMRMKSQIAIRFDNFSKVVKSSQIFLLSLVQIPVLVYICFTHCIRAGEERE